MDSKFPVALLRRIAGSSNEYKCIQLDSNEVSFIFLFEILYFLIFISLIFISSWNCSCLFQKVSIGRSKENNYTIADLLISRKHAVFKFRNDQWTVESVV